MRLSRLRIRLTAAFALAFTGALGALIGGLLWYLWRESDARLTTRLREAAAQYALAVAREAGEPETRGVERAAPEVAKEWPLGPETIVVVDSAGTLRGARGDTALLTALPSMLARVRPGADGEVTVHGDRFLVTLTEVPGSPARVVAAASREGIETDAELLAGALAIASPLILLAALAGGYAMARWALRPADALRASIAAIGPTSLAQRLPVEEPPDEIDALAVQFNGLLTRLDDAQRRNRGFVRQAAHQIRTPLTLVLGEAGHGLEGGAPRGPDEWRAALARIRLAAELMSRRVDELFLLAEADAGEPVTLADDVELDGLALEVTDLMRARATALGRSLALGPVASVVVRANARLLREAVLEMLENACRHGTSERAVTLSVETSDGHATVAVDNAGPPIPSDDRAGSGDDAGATRGLGLPILMWIADAHGGSVRVERANDGNRVVLRLPIAAAVSPA